jgi:hypothetical protein
MGPGEIKGVQKQCASELHLRGVRKLKNKSSQGPYHNTFYGRNIRNKLECLSLASLSSLV